MELGKLKKLTGRKKVIVAELLSNSKSKYSGDYQSHLFEQYKLYIESVEKTSDRRQQANNYFIAINTFIVSLIGLTFQIKTLGDLTWVKILIATLGVVISIIFFYLIRSYKQLNTGKFSVIHEIEKYLPLALYKYEWEVLGEGRDKAKYYPFSHIELIIPWIFGILYGIIGTYYLTTLFDISCKIVSK